MNEPWAQERWHVSPFNFAAEVRAQVDLPRDLTISDCVLRDGEQQPGVIFSPEDKMSVAQALDEIGIPEIEVGTPAVSREELATVEAIAKAGLKAKIRVLALARKDHLDLAASCGAEIVVVTLPAGYLQLEHKLRWPEERVIETAVELTKYAHEKGLFVVLSPMDTVRSDIGFLRRYLSTVVSEGHVDRVRLTDTAGTATPLAIKHLVRDMLEITKLPIEIHCHNDFGLGTANVLAGLEAGASVASTALNGLGERAGNAATEEVILALRMLYNVDLGLKLEELYRTSLLLQEMSGVRMAPHKAVVGETALAHEAGAVVAGWIANPFTAEPYLPEVVGQTTKVLLGKMSGKAAVAWKLNQLGILASDEQLVAITQQVKEEAERTGLSVSEEALKRIYHDSVS